MDDVDDDARYPHHRPRPPNYPQFPRNFNDQEEEEDEDEDGSNSYEIDDDDDDDDKKQNSVHHQPVDDKEAVDDDDDDEDEESSLESRGKRRRLDNFEIVPRNPTTSIIPNSKPPVVKSLPPDWSEDSSFLLLEAWGDLFVKNGRKSLKSDEWSEVAKKVNQGSVISRSESQCRNRLDTLKKKYKKEKARMAEEANFKSNWVYFKRMDSLMSLPLTNSSPVRLKCGVDAGEYVLGNSRVVLNRANGINEMRDSPGDSVTDDEDDDESDGLPPMMSEQKGRARSGSASSSSFSMLANAIRKFGEVYEKIESSKRQQMVELERMRKEFHRDLEVQTRQILERAQAEFARINQDEGQEDDGDDDVDDDIDGSAENLSG